MKNRHTARMFRLSGVSKYFDSVAALQSIDLTVPRGLTTVLIGPSGCGKSTLLRLMLGLLRPDTGRVRFEEQPIGDDNITVLRRRMGFVVQEGGLFPHLTARANIALMARHIGWDPPRVQERIETLTRLTGFPEDGLARYPAQLSGGQRSRVSLMRALMLDPDVLLLDEPLGALDPMIRFELQNELKDIFRSLGKTVVLVTHDIAEAGFFADSIVLLRAGCIVQQGGLADLVERPAESFVTQFINAQRAPLEALEHHG